MQSFFVRLAELLRASFQDGNHRTINENRLRHLLLTAIQEDRLPVSELEPPLLTKLLGRIEGECRQQAEQVYLENGLAARLKSFREAAAWYDLNDDEKNRLGNLRSKVERQQGKRKVGFRAVRPPGSRVGVRGGRAAARWRRPFRVSVESCPACSGRPVAGWP